MVPPESVRARLPALRVRAEADTVSEVVCRALALFDVGLAAREAGARLVIRRPDGTEADVLLV